MFQPTSAQLHTPLQRLKVDWYGGQFHFYVKRDDLIHPYVSGNKYRKLIGHLQAFHKSDKSRLLSFGGGNSNHLHALGYYCAQENIPLICLFRGHSQMPLSPVVRDLKKWGHEIAYISREHYKRRHRDSMNRALEEHYEDVYIIPEGGSGPLAAIGFKSLVEDCREQLGHIHYFITPMGSGGTMAGLLQHSKPQEEVIGHLALKHDHPEEILAPNLPNLSSYTYDFHTEGHHGGFAKINSELVSFCMDIHRDHDLLFDPIYTAKMFYSLSKEMISLDKKDLVTNIVLLHTGGLQGWRGVLENPKMVKQLTSPQRLWIEKVIGEMNFG